MAIDTLGPIYPSAYLISTYCNECVENHSIIMVEIQSDNRKQFMIDTTRVSQNSDYFLSVNNLEYSKALGVWIAYSSIANKGAMYY